MTKIIELENLNNENAKDVIDIMKKSKKTVALTGAGISVESGIPDFRSEGGLWTVFEPGEYATINVFFENPKKAWKLYRAIAETLIDSKPNPAHTALATLEKNGLLDCVITQNIDSLHQRAGSESVIEIHGEHENLQCLSCGGLTPFEKKHIETDEIPHCEKCDKPLKPNVVLFGEQVRDMDKILETISGCDLMLVVGASVQVAPASMLPSILKESGGQIIEFNKEETDLTKGSTGGGFFSMALGATSDYLIKGPAGKTLPKFVELVV